MVIATKLRAIAHMMTALECKDQPETEMLVYDRCFSDKLLAFVTQ
ncbi:MAG: hypothetical protein ACFBSG_00550 [Leptolyngbyaceae cyanobacterium]